MLNFDLFFLSIIFLQVLLNIFFIKLWSNDALKKFHGVYSAEQKIHKGFIPRFGGFVMISVLLFITVFDQSFLAGAWVTHILLCLIPLIFITLLEDIYNNILPMARLVFIFLSSILVLSTRQFDLPLIDHPYFYEFFYHNSIYLVILLIISIAAMVNAFNLIDGVNGLLLFTFVAILLSINLMANMIGDNTFSNLSSYLLLICIVQLFFNFPKAFIFAGDLGAYTFGFIIAVLVIMFFGRNSDFLTWQAILILVYPSFEIIFTITRRLCCKKSVFKADSKHLHHKIFNLLNRLNIRFANALSAIILLPLWSFPVICLIYFGEVMSLNNILLGFMIYIIIYLIFYFLFNKFSSSNYAKR